jgi:hypothetical protein
VGLHSFTPQMSPVISILLLSPLLLVTLDVSFIFIRYCTFTKCHSLRGFAEKNGIMRRHFGSLHFQEQGERRVRVAIILLFH